VIRSRTMACLACYVDFSIGGGISASAWIIVLAQVGRVAVRTHIIPSLIDTGPMQWIRKRNFLTWIEKEPALSAALPRATVPCDAERLQASARHRDQILLQRRDAKGVLDFVIPKSAVSTIGTDHELWVPAKEC
jgi:hypothetical protein